MENFVFCVASVSVRFRSKERGTRVKDRAKNGASERALVPFLARPKPKIPFLGLSLLRNQTEALATQAKIFVVKKTELQLQSIELVSLWQSKCCGRSLLFLSVIAQ